jgi:putative membrane-bound dehydrogenase-like protein
VLAATFAAICGGQGYPPAEAVQRMKVADGFRVKLVAAEPDIRQPILTKFDERGRLWVIQYLQYPNPAGLKRIKVDRYSRTTYDRIPEPPPRGPRGADRITIVEDTDGDGRGDKFKDFTSGLNLATGLAIGHGGVFVIQAPYLLFYPDRNRDDVPDTDPEVLLEGFGMEDSQSLANHLTWGPDGWLYGLNGSTTTCRVRGVEFQQGVWRYHPITRNFELFSEGGGNIYGLAFDANGNLFYSSNGGALFWHAVQGAYYQKSFGKHGPLHNPYAYGYFSHVKHDGVPGGHVVLGGLVYSGESFPERFREVFLGGNFLGRSAAWWDVKPRGSTVEAKLGGLLFDSNDTWFCPTDLAQAPDGSVYVCDFHDARTAHPDPDADWDRRNGRIYRVEAIGTKPAPSLDLGRLSSAELVQMLKRRNRWYADQARVILAARRDRSVWPALRAMAEQTADSRQALQGLWGLHVSGGLDDAFAVRMLQHPYEYVRSWTVRLLADQAKAPAAFRDLARHDPSPAVRAQLAASAKRLAPAEALAILDGIHDQNRDRDDPFIPWLMWWAMEDKAISGREEVVRKMARAEAWSLRSRHDDQHRLIRRYAAEGTSVAYSACARLLAATPEAHRASMLAALDQGLAERAGIALPADTGVFQKYQTVTEATVKQPKRPYAPVDGELLAAIGAEWRRNPDHPLVSKLAMRAGIGGAAGFAAKKAADPDLPPAVRAAFIGAMEANGEEPAALLLLPLLGGPAPVRDAAIGALGRFDNPAITDALLRHYRDAPERIADILLSRPGTAARLIEQAATLGPERLKQVAAFKDARLDAMVRRKWGAISEGTPEEKLATVRRLNNDLRAAAGDEAAGKRLYFSHCGSCHRMKGAGGTLGMELTDANRGDRYYLLTHIVDPSAFIRKEYMTVRILTRDGRLATGLIAEEDAASVTLVNAGYQKTRIARTDIEKMEESAVSVMPEGILENLKPGQLRDLFAFLQAK